MTNDQAGSSWTTLPRWTIPPLLAVTAVLIASCGMPAQPAPALSPQGTSSAAGAATGPSCTPQPCGTAGDLTVAVTGADGTITGDPNNAAFTGGGLQLTITASNNSAAQETLLSGYFHRLRIGTILAQTRTGSAWVQG